jgi:general secretion pathway protein L
LAPVLRRVLGLDIGSHAVKALELRQTLRGVEVGQLRLLSLDAPGPTLAEELREFIQAYGLPTDHVVCALPGDRISSRRLSFPFRDRRRIAAAVPFEIEGLVPFELDEFCIDWEIVSRERSQADVIATLAPRSEVALLLQTLSDAGIEPRILEAEGLVLANLFSLFQLEGTRLLADLGHRKTTLCLVIQGRPVATRTLPLAGQALTQALAKQQGLSEGEAERYKLETGVFADGLDAGGSEAHALLDRLARELVRTLGSLDAVLAGSGVERIEEITLLGGTARLHRLPEYLEQRTGLPVATLGPPAEPVRASLLSGGDPLIFAPALALALRGTGLARTRMNFRQQEFARRVDFRRLSNEMRSTSVLLAVVVVLALASGIMRMSVQNQQAGRVEEQVEALYREAFPDQPVPENMLTAMRNGVRDARDRADLLGVYAGNLSALDLLTELSARVPPELPILFEELNIDRQMVRVRGHAESFENVDRLRAELSGFEPFSQIRVSEIQTDSRRGGKTFNLVISLGDAREGS